MMNIEIAKQHQQKIMELREQLNAAIAHATLDGVHTEMEIYQVTTIGMRYYPTVNITVLVNPEDLEV